MAPDARPPAAPVPPPVRLGADLVAVQDWHGRLARSPRVREIAFTAEERRHCGNDSSAWALTWAFKEAVGKLLGTGFAGLGWRGIDVAFGTDRSPVAVTVRGPGRRFTAHSLVGHIAPGPGEHVAVVVSTRPVTGIAVEVMAVPPWTGRYGRAALCSRIAREAADRGVRWLDHRAAPMRWTTTKDGAPVATGADGRHVGVSLAHTASWAIAAVVTSPLPQGAGFPAPPLPSRSNHQYLIQSVELTFN